jgi:hypothetical protein
MFGVANQRGRDRTATPDRLGRVWHEPGSGLNADQQGIGR